MAKPRIRDELLHRLKTEAAGIDLHALSEAFVSEFPENARADKAFLQALENRTLDALVLAHGEAESPNPGTPESLLLGGLAGGAVLERKERLRAPGAYDLLAGFVVEAHLAGMVLHFQGRSATSKRLQYLGDAYQLMHLKNEWEIAASQESRYGFSMSEIATDYRLAAGHALTAVVENNFSRESYTLRQANESLRNVAWRYRRLAEAAASSTTPAQPVADSRPAALRAVGASLQGVAVRAVVVVPRPPGAGTASETRQTGSGQKRDGAGRTHTRPWRRGTDISGRAPQSTDKHR